MQMLQVAELSSSIMLSTLTHGCNLGEALEFDLWVASFMYLDDSVYTMGL